MYTRSNVILPVRPCWATQCFLESLFSLIRNWDRNNHINNVSWSRRVNWSWCQRQVFVTHKQKQSWSNKETLRPQLFLLKMRHLNNTLQANIMDYTNIIERWSRWLSDIRTLPTKNCLQVSTSSLQWSPLSAPWPLQAFWCGTTSGSRNAALPSVKFVAQLIVLSLIM